MVLEGLFPLALTQAWSSLSELCCCLTLLWQETESAEKEVQAELDLFWKGTSNFISKTHCDNIPWFLDDLPIFWW